MTRAADSPAETVSRIDVPPAKEGDGQSSQDLPFALHLDLTVRDAGTIAELCTYPEGEQRDQFVLQSLRIGVLALKQARGQIDADLVRREGERLLHSLDSRLGEHASVIDERLKAMLTEYFDPQSGRFQERIERLIRRDGELEQLLGRQIGGEDSELCKTLTAHFGEESELMKLLSPDQSKGLLAALRETLDDQLRSQREHVLGQFSLDNKEGALARFINELTERQGEFSDALGERLDIVVGQFSLDDDNSALSRLMRNVENAQRKITREFSLDEESSALSRLKSMMEATNRAIDGHLSLDDDQSALARLRKELLTLLAESSETNREFQEEVKGALREMVARREESLRSTRHGLEFEDAAFQFLQNQSQKTEDIATHTGNTTGRIKNCKVGDCVIELGPDNTAAGVRIVVEMKEKSGYNPATAREEIDEARKNRDSQVGLFIFSKKTAPEGLESFIRRGNDVFVIWDSEDVQSDIYLQVGLTLARALCVQEHNQQSAQPIDFDEIEEAILEVEKRARDLDDVVTWTETIQKSSEKILKKIRITRKALDRQVEALREKTDNLKSTLSAEPETEP